MATKAFLQKAYLAYFGRPVDPTGEVDFANTSEAAVADAFAASAESKALYGTTFNYSQINAIYQALFNRDAEPAGLAYWYAKVADKTYTAAGAAIAILNGAQNADKTAIDNKLAASAAFSAALDTSAELVGYSGDAAAASARSFLSSVTTTAATAAAVDAAVAAAVAAKTAVAGQTFTLTTSMDALTGTANADTFNAVLQADGATGTTVAPGDVLNGGSGNDVLSIAVAGGLGADYTLSAVQTTGIEKVLLSNFDTHATRNNTIDTSLMKGVTTVGLSASAAEGDTIFTGMTSLVGAEMRNGAADLTLTYSSTAVAGTADTQALTVSGLTAGTFTANGTETVAITSELVKSTLAAVASDALKKVTVSGAADLKITAALDFASNGTATAPGAVVDASAMTGKLTITTTASEVLSVTGGSGDDTITVGSLTKDDTVAGGAGTDTLVMPAATLTTQFTKVSGIETVAFAAGVAAQTLDASKLSSGVTTIQLDLSDDTDGSSALIAGTVSNLDGQTVVIKHSVADAADANNSDGTGYTITNKVDTAADTVNVTLDSIGLNTAGAANYGVDSLNVANFETVNLNSKKSTTVTANELVSLTDTSAKTLNITGDADLTLTQSGTSLTKVDASALTGKLNLTFGANKVNVTGSAQADTFVFAGNLDNNDVIDGGAGADSLTASVSGLTATTGALHIANVESIVLTTGGDNALNLADVKGATSVSVSGNVQTITGLDLTAKLIATAANTLKVTAADATGVNDTLTVEQKVDGDVTTVISASDIENLNLVLNDTAATVNNATFTLTSFAGKTVTVTESATTTTTGETVNLGTLNKTVTTVDTTGVKGAATVNVSAATVATTISAAGVAVNTITGSAYGDTITVGTTGAVTHVIDGGAGTDTLNIGVKAGFVNAGSITNVETINATATPGDAIAVTTAFTSGVKTLNLLGGNSISTFDAGTVNDAMTTLNASGYGGALTATIATDKFDDTLTVTGGALATDAITSTYATAATYKPKTTAVETLKITASDAATTAISVVLDLTNTTGVTTVEATVGDAETFTVSNITNQLIRVKAANATTAAPTVEAKLVDATGSADSVSFELKQSADANSIADSTILKTTDIETINLKISTGAETVSLANLAMTDTTKYESLVVTGDKALTVSALNANVNSIDASGMGTGGSFVQAGRSGTTAATYKGSAGADTFLMKNSADAIDGGAGTDTLKVSGNLILGGILVDLTSTTDQITTYNGSANATVQTGIENIDLSGITGNFGADITAAKTSASIVGTKNADQIVTAAGATISQAITGGAGADAITLGAHTGVVTINQAAGDSASQSAPGGLVVAIPASGVDVITGLNIGDTFQLAAGTYTAIAGTTALTVGTTIAGSTALDANIFTSGGNTYLAYETTVGADATHLGAYEIVQLVGITATHFSVSTTGLVTLVA